MGTSFPSVSGGDDRSLDSSSFGVAGRGGKIAGNHVLVRLANGNERAGVPEPIRAPSASATCSLGAR
jgi:hypothetical protein